MPKSFYSKVVGVSYENEDGMSRQAIIKKYVRPGHMLILEREPNNPRGKNSIAVLICPADSKISAKVKDAELEKYQIGYLSKEVAAELAPLIDSGQLVQCTVSDATGGTADKSSRGVNIELTVYSLEETRFKVKRLQEWRNILAEAAKEQPVVTAAPAVTPPVQTNQKNNRKFKVSPLGFAVSLFFSLSTFSAVFSGRAEPLLGIVIGLVFALPVAYVVWNYWKSRSGKSLA